MITNQIKTTAFAFVIFLIGCATAATTGESPAANLRQLIESKNFLFVPQTASPLQGRIVNLTSYFELKVSGDTVVSQLPYFGRAYTAPLDPTRGGLNFTSTRFEYTVNEKRKDGWEITILPKDATDVRQLFLSVSTNGNASLQVISNNRQSIGFNGRLMAK